MLIKSKLSEQDFINANFVLFYSKKSIKILTGLILLFLFIAIFTAVYSGNDFSSIFVPLAMSIALPLMTYLNARRNFHANSKISETIEFNFDNEHLLMKGESFTSQVALEKIYKVAQTKNWVLIWQNRQVANPIPKRDIQAQQLLFLKELLSKHNVKNNF